MKKLTNITVVALAIVAFVFTLLIAGMVPDNQFAPYKLNLDSFWEKENSAKEYRVDIDNDQRVEIVRHHNINKIGHSIEFKNGSKENQIYIFRENELFIGEELVFADIDGDDTKELLFISVKSNVASLNILSYNQASENLLPILKIRIDSVKQQSEHPDVRNNFIIVSDSCVYFNLQAGFAVQPRHIYKYSFNEEVLEKNRLTSLVSPQAQLFHYQGKPFLLANHVKSTGNTICPREADELRYSPSQDTVEIYNNLKHLVYSYGDFSSYILLYNDKLEFEFEPIEFFGWTNFTKSALLTVDSLPYIVSFTNAPRDEPDNQRSKTVSLCSLQGGIVKQIPLPHNYSDVYTNGEQIVFFGDKTLYLQDTSLEVQNEITDITSSCGFVDLNQDDHSEFVAFRNNVLTIFSEKFTINATLNIEHEFAPYPENNTITVFSENGKCQFMYHTRLFYYLFTYEKNSVAFLKYPFYVMVFLLLFAVLFLIYRLSIKRLEADNLKLEEKVQRRTREIVKQKTEIEKQADELKMAHGKLLELNQFKEGMTSMIVHDLKNPLNGIINSSSTFSLERQVEHMKQVGQQMLTMVLNILDVNKYENSAMKLDKSSVSLSEIGQSAVDEITFLAELKNVSIKNGIDAHISVLADKDIIQRVFVNLLSNAIKYTPNNGHVSIVADNYSDKVKVSVKDSGEGIPADKLQLVFARFKQIAAKDSGRIRSTGLGLTFCKMAVEAHGGNIRALSEVHQGAIFEFTLDTGKELTSRVGLKSCAPTENFSELSADDKLLLAPFVLQLKEIAIYKLFEIREIIRTIDETGNANIQRWKDEILSAVVCGNNEKYTQLLDLC